MIITQFRKLNPINVVLLVGLGFLLCITAFVHLPDVDKVLLVEPVISKLWGSGFSTQLSPQLNIMLTFGLTLLQALYLNMVINRYNFFPRPNFLVALLYMTLASLTLPFLVLSPILICNFIFIWMLDKLLGIYHRTMVLTDMLDVGIIVGLGSLIYFPFVLFIIAVWYGLYLFRPFDWREWFVPLLGLGIIYFLLWVVYFWNGLVVDFSGLWDPSPNPVAYMEKINQYDLLILIPIALIIVLFSVLMSQTIFKQVVYVRKTMLLLFGMLLIGLAAFFLAPAHQAVHFLLLVPSVSIYMAYYFNYAQTKWMYESVFVFLLVMIWVFQIL